MIDAEVPGDACTHRILALNAAARRHHEIIGEQGLADFAVAVGATCRAEQGGVLLPGTELARRDEAAFPEPLAIVPGAGFVRLEAPAGRCFDIQGKAVANQHLAETCGVALDLAHADAPFLVGGVGTEVVAADLLAVDQLGQLIARLDPAGPAISVLVNAELVDGRDIDAVEAVGNVAELKRAAVPDDGGGGRTLAGRKDDR